VTAVSGLHATLGSTRSENTAHFVPIGGQRILAAVNMIHRTV